MSRRTQENLVAVLILCVFIATIVAATGYGPRARLVPIPIAAIGAVLVLCQLVLQNLKSQENLQIDLLEMIATDPGIDASSADEGNKNEGGVRLVKELQALGLVLSLIALFFLFGPIPAMFMFTTAYFVISKHYSLLKGVTYALAYTFAVYAIFVIWLKIDLEYGIFDILGML